MRGRATAAKTGILKTDQSAPTTFLTTRTYYDKEYSVIQVNKQNHLGGSDITSSAYDFANRVTKTRRDHTATPPGGTLKTYTIREEYVYDHAGRVRFTRHKINSNNWVVTTAPVYDELGRLADKRLHASNYDGTSAITLGSSFNYLQSLDYTYNIRGWLTGMNDVANCNTQSGDQLADLFKLQLSYDAPVGGGTAQYNGNISTLQWRSYINTTCLAQQQYRFGYDATNRLTAADHYTNSGSWTFTNNYTESNITYDLNGNLKTYTRRGLTSGTSTFGVIDNLTYTYGDTYRPDRLTGMAESGSTTKGFKYTGSLTGDHYLYDLNGNLSQDKHKDLFFAYNHLNLPNSINNSAASYITLTYTADGEKLTKVAGGVTKNYVAGIEYTDANLEAIYHAEGRCVPNGATAFYYEYTIKDHLGNARVNWRANGTAVTFLEELHYYPFGMLMEGIGTNPVTANAYKYNSKELNVDLGLNWYDYGARWYDAAVGRWWSVDPLAEKYAGWSSYNYVMSNPIKFVDPEGKSVRDHIFLTSDGKEINRIIDPSINKVTIVQDWHPPMARPEKVGGSDKTYNLRPMLQFFSDNRNDFFDNRDETIKTKDGKIPKDLPVERAISLYDNNGVVEIGDNRPISEGGERVVGINPAQVPKEKIQMIVNDSQVGFLHTEPLNERNSNLMIGTPKGGYQTMSWAPNPSGFDEVNYKPKDGYHSVIVRPQEVVFFKSKSDSFIVQRENL